MTVWLSYRAVFRKPFRLHVAQVDCCILYSQVLLDLRVEKDTWSFDSVCQKIWIQHCLPFTETYKWASFAVNFKPDKAVHSSLSAICYDKKNYFLQISFFFYNMKYRNYSLISFFGRLLKTDFNSARDWTRIWQIKIIKGLQKQPSEALKNYNLLKCSFMDVITFNALQLSITLLYQLNCHILCTKVYGGKSHSWKLPLSATENKLEVTTVH